MFIIVYDISVVFVVVIAGPLSTITSLEVNATGGCFPPDDSLGIETSMNVDDNVIFSFAFVVTLIDKLV